MNVSLSRSLFLPVLLLLLGGCQEAVSPSASTQEKRIEAAEPIKLTVHKSPTCGCCKHWVSHIEQQGLFAESKDTLEMDLIKNSYGIRPHYRSCHTGVSAEGYVFEGHVPAKYIKQFLAEAHEDALGLAVPAMPVGSPGMEVDDKFMAYDVLLLLKDGSSRVYASVSRYEDQF